MELSSLCLQGSTRSRMQEQKIKEEAESRRE